MEAHLNTKLHISYRDRWTLITYSFHTNGVLCKKEISDKIPIEVFGESETRLWPLPNAVHRASIFASVLDILYNFSIDKNGIIRSSVRCYPWSRSICAPSSRKLFEFSEADCTRLNTYQTGLNRIATIIVCTVCFSIVVPPSSPQIHRMINNPTNSENETHTSSKNGAQPLKCFQPFSSYVTNT